MRCREAKEGELILRENLGAKMFKRILGILTGTRMVDCNKKAKGNGKYVLFNPTRWLTT